MSLPKPYYEDEAVTIYHGDCREMLPQLPGFDVVVTDPPYGIRHRVGWDGPLKGEKIVGDCDTSARDFVLSSVAGKPALVFGTWRVERPAGIRAILVWDKGSWGMGDLSIPWTPSWEEIYVLGHGFSGRRSNGVLRYNAPQTSNGRVHPNQKPLPLVADLLAKCPGSTVLDPFMGSGTTLRAAKDLGRKAIGIEIEEKYCEIAAKRMAQEVLPL